MPFYFSYLNCLLCHIVIILFVFPLLQGALDKRNLHVLRGTLCIRASCTSFDVLCLPIRAETHRPTTGKCHPPSHCTLTCDVSEHSTVSVMPRSFRPYLVRARSCSVSKECHIVSLKCHRTPHCRI